MVPSPPQARHSIIVTPRLRDGLIVLTCVAAQALYLLLTRCGYHRFGFPLDDAWIHQTYARSLAQTGRWAFVPGVPSTGATSILWPLLLAPAYLLPIDPRWWTHGMGLLTLIAAALGTARLVGGDTPGDADRSPLLVSLAAGLAVALEWHLVWAAASGMETGLFTALLVWFWVWLRRHDPARGAHAWHEGLLLGIWGGLLVLVRPEGVLVVGVAGLYGLLRPGSVVARLRWGALAGIGLALILVPYFGLNVSVSGVLWPNTFYAKQTEYAALWAIPYPRRLFEQVFVSFVGPQLLLLPGLLFGLWHDVRRRPVNWSTILPLIWVSLHWGLYAARLPVTYQHGRYAIPVIPIIVTAGLRGTLQLARPHARRLPVRLASVTWLASAALLFPLMLGVLGAPAYARDVSFIEDEMVAAARWVAENTGPETTIAAHDIGALGYFAPRPLIDLAGLASPDVIPFMTDGTRLKAYVLASDAAYLVVFPRWSDAYRHMLADPVFCPVWSTAERGGYAGSSGLGPMTVYRITVGE
jgi:hypothetical protein